MASLNRNIQTGNFIPGSEEYTRPEEISIMGKYLRAGIKDLTDTLDVSGTDSPGISNKAKIKNIKNLPGEETLDGINNNSGDIKSLSTLKESLKKQEEEKLKLSESKEFINSELKENFELSETKESLNTIEKSINIQDQLLREDNLLGIKKISLPDLKEQIESNESGNLEVKDSRLYEKLYFDNPKTDKRILPDSGNKDPKFRDLDTLLGGVHYEKYSSETIARSTSPSKDAILASSTGSSDTIFVKPENLHKKESELSETSENLKINKSIDSLETESNILNKGKSISQLSNSREELNKPEKIDDLRKNIEELKKSQENLKLNKDSEILKKDNRELELSKTLNDFIKDDKEILLSEQLEKFENLSDEIKLDNSKEEIYKDPKKLALSEYVNKLLDGQIKSLSEQKESLPDELKEIVLVDYLKDTIEDKRKLQLAIDNLQDMPGEEKNIILDNFVSELNKDLKKIIKTNGKYFTQGKEIGVENLLNDINNLLSEIFNSQFIDELDIPADLLELKKYYVKILPTTGSSSEYNRQLSNLYGISALTAEELKKTLDELTGCSGNWGKKVAAYLATILGKYKNFKKYLPTEEIENFKAIVTSTFKERKDLVFIEDTGSVTKETLIRKTLNLLKTFMTEKVRRAERWVYQDPVHKLLNEYNKTMYNLSIGGQKYGDSISFKGAFKNIKTEVIDNTWDSIKGWFTSALSGSLFGASASLLTDKIKLPGHDYSYDSTIRNIPNVTGFYDKKTSTKSFSGSPHATPMEISSVDMNSSGWFTRALSKTKEYSFKDNYLLGEGIQLTLKDLCGSDVSRVSTVEDLYDVLKNSEKTTAHARTTEGVMNGMTLSSNHVWEITIEPYISRFNGYCTWLPFFQELNQLNYKKHRVRTIYDKWIPVTSFELQDKRLVNKTLGLYAGEISYPVAMEYSNELRLTIADDSFKSFRYYFDKVAEISTYESLINTKSDQSSAIIDANFAKNRKFGSFVFQKQGASGQKYSSTFDTVNKNKFAVGMYKNLCFNICIYIMTPQYSTIKKYNLLCVMKDYSIEYSGEVDSGPADVSVNFSIVGETNEYYEFDKLKEDAFFESSQEILSTQIQNDLLDDINESMNRAMDNMYEDILSKQQTPLSVINDDPYDYEIHDSIGGMIGDGNVNRTEEYLWNPRGTETRYQ